MILGLSLFLIILIMGFDQWSKAVINQQIPLNSSKIIINHLLSLNNVHNYGASWNMMASMKFARLLLILLAVIALIIIGYYIWHCRYDWRYEVALSLVFAGALGNVVSRIVNGYVTDMIQVDFINFPVFNVADSCISIGIIILIILISCSIKVRNHKRM